MNSTVNESSESWSFFDLSQLNSTAWKIGGTVTYCLIIVVVSLAANSLIVMIVYKTQNLRKPINYFIANMASSYLLFRIYWIPWNLLQMHTNSFLIGGQLGQALCKILPFFGDVFFVVSIHNLILIAVDRFGAVVFPLRSPLIRSKLCPFFIFATYMDSCRSFQFAILGEQSANSQQKRDRRNRNVLQLSFAIIIVFVLCWLLSSINVLIKEYQDTFTHLSCSFCIYN